jgi:hypothetical protein
MCARKSLFARLAFSARSFAVSSCRVLRIRAELPSTTFLFGFKHPSPDTISSQVVFNRVGGEHEKDIAAQKEEVVADKDHHGCVRKTYCRDLVTDDNEPSCHRCPDERSGNLSSCPGRQIASGWFMKISPPQDGLSEKEKGYSFQGEVPEATIFFAILVGDLFRIW